MFANIASAWLCADSAAVDADVGAVDDAEDDEASLVVELLHAPIAATAARAASPVATVLIEFTRIPSLC